MSKILIADDEKEIVRLLRMYLESDDITVLEAYDGQQAVDIVRDKIGAEHIRTVRGLGYRFDE